MTAVNGKPKIDANMVYNDLMRTTLAWLTRGRSSLLSGGNRLDPPNRDLDSECGYPSSNPDILYYRELYERGGLPARVVNIWPDECWAAHPEVYTREQPELSEFEQVWYSILDEHIPWHYLHRADRLSGIGRFGGVLIGVNDGRSLDQPVAGVDGKTGISEIKERSPRHELLYLRPFAEYSITIDKSEEDSSSPRFGQPLIYNINFGDPTSTSRIVRNQVHWSRFLHMADNREESEVFGVPRARPVLCQLHDVRKVQGGSSEMFWQGGFPGYQFKTDPNMLQVLPELSEEKIRDTIESYINGLQRYLSAVGGEWNSLAPQVADPSPNLDKLIQVISAVIGVPARLLMGSEAAHLASSQDSSTWKERLRGRQKNYVEPMIIRPFINRFMNLGILPRVKKYYVHWRDLETLSDKDRAEVALKKTQAMMQYTTGRVEQMFPLQLWLSLILGISETEAQAVVDVATKQTKMFTEPPEIEAAPAQRMGTSPGRTSGGPPEGEN